MRGVLGLNRHMSKAGVGVSGLNMHISALDGLLYYLNGYILGLGLSGPHATLVCIMDGWSSWVILQISNLDGGYGYKLKLFIYKSWKEVYQVYKWAYIRAGWNV